MSWLTSYLYRKTVPLSRATGAVTNYQMKVTVYRSSGTDSGASVYIGTKCLATYDDIRFTKADGSTLLDCWIESYDSSSAVIWVEFDSIEITDTVFCMYYGNAGASAVSNGIDTFIFYEDFNLLTDGDLNGQNGWSGSALFDVETSVKYEGAKAVQVTNGTTAQVVRSISITSYNMWIQVQMRATNTANVHPIEFYIREGSNSISGVTISESNLRHLRASAWDIIIAAVNDTWYKVKVAIDSVSTHKVWVNDIPQTLSNNSNISNVSSAVNGLMLEQYISTSSPAYVDQIIVGKYLAVEPVFGIWGAEEVDTTFPEITVQPVNTEKTAGETATFSLTATGGSLTYQWQKLISGTWTDIGTSSASYTTPTLVYPDDTGFLFRCNVSNSLGDVTSDEVLLIVYQLCTYSLNGSVLKSGTPILDGLTVNLGAVSTRTLVDSTISSVVDGTFVFDLIEYKTLISSEAVVRTSSAYDLLVNTPVISIKISGYFPYNSTTGEGDYIIYADRGVEWVVGGNSPTLGDTYYINYSYYSESYFVIAYYSTDEFNAQIFDYIKPLIVRS